MAKGVDPNGLAEFTGAATSYQQWLLHGSDSGVDAARTALLLLTRLYAAYLQLPPPDSTDESMSDDDEVSSNESLRVLNAAQRLPIDMYAAVFDPLPLPPEEPVIGSLADDLQDIYRDIISGLRAHEAGRTAGALEHWATHFFHWGEHATGAIRALHCWLVAHRTTAPTRSNPALMRAAQQDDED